MEIIINKPPVGQFRVYPDWDENGQPQLKVKFEEQESHAFFSVVNGQRVLSVPEIRLHGKGRVHLFISQEQEKELLNLIEIFKTEHLARFESGEYLLVLRWEQSVSNYDFPTMALQEWELSRDSRSESCG